MPRRGSRAGQRLGWPAGGLADKGRDGRLTRESEMIGSPANRARFPAGAARFSQVRGQRQETQIVQSRLDLYDSLS